MGYRDETISIHHFDWMKVYEKDMEVIVGLTHEMSQNSDLIIELEG